MLKLPVSTKTFKRGFLGGKGDLAITLSPAAGTAFLPEQRFPDKARELVVAKVGAASPELSFGARESIACKTSFSGGGEVALVLSQPGDPIPIRIGDGAAAQVPPDRIGALVMLKAHAKAAAAGTVAGPAGLSFGLSAKAGGGVEFSRFRLYDRNDPAGSILLDVLSDVRLPHTRGTPESAPDAGEIVQFGYSGFLEVGAALNWGYSLAGTEGIRVRDIEASIEYALKAKAALSMNYRLAGDFAITLQPGREPGFVRIAVHKRRDARFQFAAGFDLDGKYRVNGLPETSDEFLAAFLGTDVKSALQVFQKAVTLSDLDTLEQTVGKLLSGTVQDLAHKWIDTALDRTNVGRFLGELEKAIGAYNSIDDRIAGVVMDLYEETLGPHKEKLELALKVIKRLNSKADLAKLQDSKAWELIQRLTGGDVFKVAFGESREGFAELHATATKVLDVAASPDFARLRELIDGVKGQLKLDVLFGRLEKIATPAKLKALSDTTLQGLVERVVGRTFEEIRESDTAAVLREVHDTLKKLDAFKNKFHEHIKKALEQSVSLRINFLYTRATADQALLDVEIDITEPAGRQLFQDAAAGRMRDVFLQAKGSSLVRVNEALLSHEVTRASQLQINVLGWTHKRLVEVVSRTQHSLQSQAGGLVQVFATEAAIKEQVESGGKHKEKMQSNFLLRMAGESFGATSPDATRKFIVRTLERMSVNYDVLHSDDLTDARELAEYLALGEHLKLVPAGMLAELQQQFPDGFGTVTARYVVRYDHKAIHDAFTALPTDDVIALARTTARRLVASQFVQSRERAFKAAIGLAYANDAIAAIFYDQGITKLERTSITVRIPGAITGGASVNDTIGAVDRDPRKSILGTLFNVEARLSERLGRLDRRIDEARLRQKPIEVEELEEAARDVVSAAGDMNAFGGPNTFFAIFDELIAIGGAGKAHRESALVLEIQPPGGDKVTKFLMQGSA